MCRLCALTLIGLFLPASLYAWTPSAPVLKTAQDSLDGRVAMDAGGKIHVVWRENMGGGTQVYYSTNLNGSFSGAVQISPGGYQSFSPVVACRGSDVHMAWAGDPAGNNNWDAFYRKSTGGTLGSVINASNTGIKSLRPALAIRGAVGPVIAWDEALQADDRYDTFYADWNGSGFNSAINIANTPGGSAYGSVNVNVVVAPNGDVTAVWVDRDNAPNEYHPNARRRVGGVWQPRQEISTRPLGPSTPGLAAGADNSVHTAYESGGTIWYQRWNGSSWTSPQALPGGLDDPLRCKIAVDDRGYAHVVCDDSHYGSGEIWYTTNASGSWGVWINVSNTPSTNSITPDISYSANALAVAWMENSNQAGSTGVFNIWYARHDVPPPGPSGSMSGMVRNSNGVPIANATVSCGGRETISAADGTYTVTAIPAGTYTASAAKLYFTPQSVPNVTIAQDQTTALNFVINASSPAPVTTFIVNTGNTTNSLLWTNPGTGNFTGTMIRVKTTGFPSDPGDGVLVIDQAGAPSSNGFYAHVGLTNGVPHYYAAFAHEGSGAYAGGVTAGPARSAVKPDSDNDGDVDAGDFGHFQACLSGANNVQTDPDCIRARLDADFDVDADDLAIFLNCMAGPDVYAIPACAG